MIKTSIFQPPLRPLAISLLLALNENAIAAQACENPVGKFVSIEGKIEFEHSGPRERQAASLESALCQNDMIYVGANSRAAIALANEAVLRLDQNTTMRLTDVASQPEKRSLLELVIGSFKSFSRPPRTFAVNTPYLNGLIEGTEFAMRVDGDSSMTTVYEGKVTTSNEQGKLTLQRGESALAKAGQAPQPYLMVKPADAVQWTLYYPPLFAAMGGGQGQIPTDVSPAVKAALDLAAGGDNTGALTRIELVPSGERDANFYLYRAALFLDVGKAGEARADIDRALAKDPDASLAYALRAIIELVGNERSQAQASAEKAVALKPSAAAKLALSYAQQSNFQLEAARNTLLSIVDEHPDDPLAWARLGELHLMFGDRDKALEAAHKAEALAPNLARTQTVLGFAALAENHEADARLAFEKAIQLSSNDPLAHFGLGLTKIKGGDLSEGRQALEASVALDANNALLRSYLGKAYYEEKRMPLDQQQYSIAKELDPSDPTPYLYDAIDKQTTNRPVEALESMQKAIELNDNRAVYRSRQLLDSDLAARSASIARVYSDLGFQELALRQGWKSVNTDPSNFSSHRFLADSYSALPRHAVARVSELLQSQLLQPLNMTPIQPHQGETNLFLISSGGPAGLSFNEFNPVFNRDGLTVQANSMAGEKNTYAGEGVVSGIYKKAAFSLGAFHFSSDGFRASSNQRDDIANAFVQYELSPQTSVQAEYRNRQSLVGDRRMFFFQDNYVYGQRNSTQTETYRFGLRHNLSENSTLLASLIYVNERFGNLSPFSNSAAPLLAFSSQNPISALSPEIQHLFRSSYVNLTTGAGYFDYNSIAYGNLATLFGDLPLPLDNSSQKKYNVYSYANIKPLDNLTFTLGASGDFTSSHLADPRKTSRINPKLGLTWSVLPNTTLRAAWFTTTKRSQTLDQTLEPTQVAGFNQFYDDMPGTRTERFGVGVDQKFSTTVFGGLEVSKRNLDIQANTFNSNFEFIPRLNWQEELARGYLFWTPNSMLALRLEYQYETYDANHDLSLPNPGTTNVGTHRVPIGVNFFHPSGFGSSLKLTYVNQAGQFQRLSNGNNDYGHDEFVTVDAALQYRLPKRYGFLSIGASNLFDQKFNYYDADYRNPALLPTRMAFARITLAFP